ncbi:hypothetical protein K435DRAFT_712358 [Dendrothele bispora CBS 962.96]|uniref:Alpha/beta hydrolase fold-3 domain-containing protein n=1 Tax=Dendrothele bispora (strain CBS 962.96) TaxID=1314807 RepID=A0A4S8MRH7_DENBC|nr:hypothetical protein K435DRAFT_712358 [Dendrothele bispora CBS 962.96]
MAEYAHLSVPDLEIAEEMRALAQLPKPPDYPTIREILRNVVTPEIVRLLGPELPSELEYEINDYMINVADGSGTQVLARNIIPRKKTPDESFPLLFWTHGGGWSAGHADLDDPFLKILCAKLRISVVNCEYRLAPEHPFPTGLNDCYAVLKHVAGNMTQFSASLRKGFIVAGASSGANFSAVLALRARDDPFFEGKPLTGQLLLVPSVIHKDAYSELPEEFRSRLLSLEQNANAPGFGICDLNMSNSSYKAPPLDPYVSPLLASSHKGLPPVFIQVAGFDPLRDDGFLYEKVLKDNGVSTRLIAYPGVPHGILYSFPQTKVGKKFRKDLEGGLQWLLNFSSQE